MGTNPSQTTPHPADGVKKIAASSDDELKKWYIDRSRLVVGKTIGEGQFGAVKMATFSATGMKVAMKTFKRGNMNFEDFKNEIETMKNLRHPNLVKLLGCSEIKAATNLYLIMEYHEHGSLKDCFSKTFSRQQLNKLPIKRIALEVASGMNYLSSENYIHRDLAARNVLLARDLTPKIADFGLAKYLVDSEDSALDGCMPWKWSAPEVMGGRKEWSSKCDVWSFGVFCWELYNDCKQPYGGISSSCDLIDFFTHGSRLSFDRIPPPLHGTLEKCWMLCTKERTDFNNIVKELEKYLRN